MSDANFLRWAGATQKTSEKKEIEKSGAHATSSMRMSGNESAAAGSSDAFHFTTRMGGGEGRDSMSPGRSSSGSVRRDRAATLASTSMTMAVMLACESHCMVRSTMTSSLQLPAAASPPCCSCAMVTSGSSLCCPCACATTAQLLIVACICSSRLAAILHLLPTASTTLLQKAASSAEWHVGERKEASMASARLNSWMAVLYLREDETT